MRNFQLDKCVFGRTESLRLLKKRVIDLKDGYRQNIALIGSQFVGKSMILQHFISEIDEEGVHVVYLELENKNFHYFYSKFIGSLLYNYSKNKRLPLHDDIDLLMESTKQSIPQSVQVIGKIRESYKKKKIHDAYLGLLTLPEVFTNETGEHCVIILDEFQNLENFAIEDAYQALGKKIMTHKKCLYILSSSFPHVAKKILSEKLTLLFGSFEDVVIDTFRPEVSQQYIEDNLKDIKIGAQLRSFITDFTGGHPLYLNLLCREIKNLCAIHNQGEVYMPILSLAIENAIFDRWGVISRHFELINNEICLGKGNQAASMILVSLSNGRSKIEEILADVDIKKSQLIQKLNRFAELGILIKNGQAYYFKDKLFKYWVRFVYQIRIKDIELAPDKQYKQFKSELIQCVEKFKASTRQEFSSRIIELLHCIDNGVFDLNGRKYKVPTFRSIEPSKLRNDSGANFDVIKAEVDEEAWFIVMKKDIISENDIGAIIKASKEMVKKPKRRLIISLMDLEENAKLKALQERFWIWNQCDINALLSMFDKPFILK